MDNISVEKCPSIIFFIVLCLQFLIEVFLMFHNFLRKLVLCHVFVGFFTLSRLYIAKSIKRIQYFVELYVVVCHFLFNPIGILFYAIAIYSLKKSSKSHSNSNVLKVLYYVCILTTETGELLLGQSLEIQ